MPILAVSLLMACGSANKPVTHHVTIEQMKFVPDVLEVAPGDSVVWTNEDLVQHNVVNKASNGWESDFISKGESFGIKVEGSGTLDYLCTIHPVMTAKIVIKQ